MRYLLYLTLFIGLLPIANGYRTVKENQLIESMVSSFYTGCMSGVIAVIETGLFKEGKNAIEANSNFYKLKQNCLKQQQSYRKLLETK